MRMYGRFLFYRGMRHRRRVRKPTTTWRQVAPILWVCFIVLVGCAFIISGAWVLVLLFMAVAGLVKWSQHRKGESR